MGLGEERPPSLTILCVSVSERRRAAIGFRVRLQISEALTSSRFSFMQLRMVLA